MLTITRDQARQFILSKQGLIGPYRFIGKEGAYEYVCKAGCIQFDPVDVCGKNAELTLQSRVKGFKKSMLYDLLYKDRRLVDYADKELSIWPVKDWPYFKGYRERSKDLGATFEGLEKLKAKAVTPTIDPEAASDEIVDAITEKVTEEIGKVVSEAAKKKK